MTTDDLSPLEREYRDKLHALFARVNPQQPEKGIRALLERARKETSAGKPETEALAEMYAGAEERTERRIALLSNCSLENRPTQAD